MTLKATLNDLALSFANAALDAIRGVTLDQLVTELELEGAIIPTLKLRGGEVARAVAPKKTATVSAPKKAAVVAKKGAERIGRLARRSEEDIAAMAARIVALCATMDGARAEQIRTALDIDVKEMPRPIKYALDNGMLRTTGQKRATTYFVKGKGGAKKAAKIAAKAEKPAKTAKPAKAAKPAKVKAKASEPPKKRGRPKGSKNAVKAAKPAAKATAKAAKKVKAKAKAVTEPPKKRGRPKGSKNAVKPAAVEAAAEVEAEPESEPTPSSAVTDDDLDVAGINAATKSAEEAHKQNQPDPETVVGA